MAKRDIKLKKEVFSNKKVIEEVSLGFKNLAKSSKTISEDRLKEIYDEIYYDIPIDGKDSHKNIVEQTYNYLYQNYLNNLDSKINSLAEQIAAKNTELDSFDDLNIEEHPVYENGSFLMHGTAGVPYQDSPHIWVMQEGRKRRFESENHEVFIQTKRALNLPIDTFDGRYFVGTQELTSIPDGTHITKTEHLNHQGLQIIPEGDLPDLTVRNAYYNVDITCLGEEIGDILQFQLGAGDGVDWSSAQFTLEGGCTIKYLKDDFSTDETSLSVETIVISKDETINIDILRDGLGAEDSGIPSNINQFYQDHGAYDVQAVQYNGNDVPNYIKEWGPYGSTNHYASILFATGRLTAKQNINSYIQDTLQIPQNEDEIVLNGLPESIFILEGSGAGTDADITFVDATDNSAYHTRMIHKGDVTDTLWGNLNQSDDLQSYFDDPSNAYYQVEAEGCDGNNCVEGPVYGQPIIRYDQKYNVILGVYVKSYMRRIMFLDIATGNTYGRRLQDQLEDKITISEDGSLGWNYINWDTSWIGQRVIWQGYIGLVDYQLTEYNGDGNYFNTHSNYEWAGNLI